MDDCILTLDINKAQLSMVVKISLNIIKFSSCRTIILMFLPTCSADGMWQNHNGPD